MAGAMAARQRILGTAPGARLLAVHSIRDQCGNRREHHVQYPQRHRLVGEPGRAHHQYELCRSPKDPSLQRALKLAYDKGIVLVAAAGNAGAKSPPLFPGCRSHW